MSTFKYSRKITVVKKDEEGKAIPKYETVKDEVGGETQVVLPGQFETEEKWKKDYFNLDLFIRTHELDDGRVIVLLHDGHEETQKSPVLKNKNKKGPIGPNDVTEEKNRVWVQSEIVISLPEEVEALYKKLDATL